MKKHFYILGALCLTFVLASCGGDESSDKEGEGDKERKSKRKKERGSVDLSWRGCSKTKNKKLKR